MRVLNTVLVILAVTLVFTPLAAAQVVEINYQNLNLSFHQPASSSQLIVTERGNSIASAFLKDGSGNTLDSADIYNLQANHWFDLLFGGTVTNGAGIDDISIPALWQATDNVTTLAAPSLEASFLNANLLGDLDGVTFGNGVLRIEGVIQSVVGNDSILLNPTPNWVYAGGFVPTAPGADGIADQMTIAAAKRTDYHNGILAVLEVSLNQFGDGTSTAGLDADQLFAQALLHGGFTSTDAQIQVTIVPVPGAALLGVIGLGMVRPIRRWIA